VESTRTEARGKLAFLLAVAAFLWIAGCGKGAEETISGLAGGTSSKDKQEIGPAVQPEAAASSESAETEALSPPKEPVVASPAVASKTAKDEAAKDEAAKDEAAKDEAARGIREETLAYGGWNRKDPFRSLVTGEHTTTELVDLSVVTLVGICWDGNRSFCAVEDAEGMSFILRKGDRVKNGRIVSIRDGALVASQTILGYTTTVQLHLEENGEERVHG
jgi:hypothetical protein